MFPFSNIAVVSATIAAVAAQLSSQQITKDFRGGLSKAAEIYFPSDPDWTDEVTQRWTVYPPTIPIYLAAIKPATANDVSAIVKIAAQYNISYLATGGGHGLSTTLGRMNDGIDIDLSNFQDVTIDKKAMTVTVGGATRFGKAIDLVYKAGFEIVTGGCPCVGAVGATVGGGLSRLQGLHGLISDNVVSFKVVTADGNILHVSDSEHPDLFWAMRGAGHNFGIVLEVTYKIYAQSNGGKALSADMIFPANASHTHWNLLKDFMTDLPPELTIVSGIRHDDQYGVVIYYSAVYYGPEDKGRKILAPFINNNPLVQNITYIDSADVFGSVLFGIIAESGPVCEKGTSINAYTIGLKKVDVPTFDQLFKDTAAFYEKYPNAKGSTMQFEMLPLQAVTTAKPTAFPASNREIKMHALFSFTYDDQSIDKAVNKWAKTRRDNFIRTSGFNQLQMYTSYAHGDEGSKAWYHESLPRLQKLKSVYDPTNQFRFNYPVLS